MTQHRLRSGLLQELLATHVQTFGTPGVCAIATRRGGERMARELQQSDT